MAEVRNATSASDYLSTLAAGLAADGPGSVACTCADVLFVSVLQPAESPSADKICRAVAVTLQRLGAPGCAARVAGEFGDHPDTAAARMRWARAVITTICPAATADGDRSASSTT